MKKCRTFFLSIAAVLLSGVVWAADDASQRDRTEQLQETITEEANYIRQLNNDNTMTPERRKAAIDAFIQHKNEELANRKQ